MKQVVTPHSQYKPSQKFPRGIPILFNFVCVCVSEGVFIHFILDMCTDSLKYH